MAIIVGSDEHRYEVIESWGRLPEDHGNACVHTCRIW